MHFGKFEGLKAHRRQTHDKIKTVHDDGGLPWMIPSNEEMVKDEANSEGVVEEVKEDTNNVEEVEEETTSELDPDNPQPMDDLPVASTKAESNDSKLGLPPLGKAPWEKAPSFVEV